MISNYTKQSLIGRKLQLAIEAIENDEQQEALVTALRQFGMFVPPILLKN